MRAHCVREGNRKLTQITMHLFIRMDDGTQRMYYTGQGPGGSTAIGVAKLSGADQFVREQATVTFA